MLLSRRLRGGFPWTAASVALAALTLLFTLSAGPAAAQAGRGQHPGQSAPAARSHHRWVKYYIVQPPSHGHKEFLFEIAAKSLGNGDRAAQIFQLNKGRLQPGGGRMEKETIILPGWILVLPANARGRGVHYGPLPVVTAAPSPAPSGRASSRASSAGSAAPSGSPAAARAPVSSSARLRAAREDAVVGGGLLLLGMLLTGALLIMRRRRGKPGRAAPDGSVPPPGPVSSAQAPGGTAPSGAMPDAAGATSPSLLPAGGGVLTQVHAPSGSTALGEPEMAYSQAAPNGHAVAWGQASFQELPGADQPGGPGYPAWLNPPPPPPGRGTPGRSASGDLAPPEQPAPRHDAASLTRPADHEQASRLSGWPDARDLDAGAAAAAPQVPHAPQVPDAPQVPHAPDAPHAPQVPDAPHAPDAPAAPDAPDVADPSGATDAIDVTGELPWPDFLAAGGPDQAGSGAAPSAGAGAVPWPGPEPGLAGPMTGQLENTGRNGSVAGNRVRADELPGNPADGEEPTTFSPVALRILGAQRSSAQRAETADVPTQRHTVASGGDWIQVVLTEAPAVRNDDKPRTGRTWLASTPYLIWTPLPYDAPDNGVAFACLGTGDKGCLFIDLAAAPGAITITGEADPAARLAESIAHQLCMAAAAGRPCIVVAVGAALPEPPPPGAAWVPSLGDLTASVPPPGPVDSTEMVFCQLRSNDDAFALARYVSSAHRRIVPVVLADLPGAPWTFTAQPSRSPSGAQHW